MFYSFSLHGVSFPRSCLTVCKDGASVALECLIDKRRNGLFIQILLLGCRPKHLKQIFQTITAKENSQSYQLERKQNQELTLSNTNALSLYLLATFWITDTSRLSSLQDIATGVFALFSSSLNGLQHKSFG